MLQTKNTYNNNIFQYLLKLRTKIYRNERNILNLVQLDQWVEITSEEAFPFFM